MEIQVLGELHVEVNGQPVTPSALKPRQILGLLLLNANRVVQTHALIREVWDDDPPETVATTLQTYILHIRKPIALALGESTSYVAQNLLVTKSSGYAFIVPPGTLDLHSYERLAKDGIDKLAQGEDDHAARLLRAALGKWSDSPLADIRPGRILGGHIRSLEESLITLEKLVEAELRRGRHDAVLADLAEVTCVHPMHENLHAQFMVALHRSGRRSQALEVYHQLRRELVQNLGLEPSSHVQRIHQAILA